ncbi:efflux RND transporter periplasmic adaptor subunit [Litorilituus sediminis]|uniref:Efflux RND transporter periplasmic adaptor subunit n=1 Tax=Litorilituus sediminis TaxID=718192 RepID=A0A4P6P665_9GAMM|nr:efflux RND transporter periplasmic adaptor subunit [Litorilituus sediminis]QBG36508.1 efflux RND transporter periplasmic adaptor subunit [Litorilituus sediminis]
MKFTKWLIVIIALASIIFGLHSYKASLKESASAQAANMPEPSATVNSIAVSTVSFQKTVQVSGEIQPFKYLSLTNEMAGQITRLNAPSGSIVNKGQVLVELDHRDEAARLIAAKANLTLNEQTLARYIKLHKNREISEESVDQARAAVDIAKSDIAVLTTAIAKKTLVAPFTAKVAIHSLEVGQYLDKNSQVLALVGINDFTWIDFNLPQVYQELSLGETVQIKPMNQEAVFDAEIIAIDPQLSGQSRQLKYRAQVPTKTLALKPNTLVSVIAPIAEQETVIAVPDLAIKRDALGNYVFLLEEAEQGSFRAKPAKVTLGERQGDQVMIVDGLSAGQVIASKGAFKLFPGMKVFVANNESSTVAQQ